MHDFILIDGKIYQVSCSHCGGRAIVLESPVLNDCTDGIFQCRGMVDCQFVGPGEEFVFNED